jgi:hypothetical protein
LIPVSFDPVVQKLGRTATPEAPAAEEAPPRREFRLAPVAAAGATGQRSAAAIQVPAKTLIIHDDRQANSTRQIYEKYIRLADGVTVSRR